jgi:hypothetical protein
MRRYGFPFCQNVTLCIASAGTKKQRVLKKFIRVLSQTVCAIHTRCGLCASSRPTEKKFHWSRRGIVTNGIFVVTNEIFAATNRIFLVNVATLQRELYASSAEVFSFTGWYLASPKARSPHIIHIFIYNATGGSNLLIR